ncbi:MAG: RimJ/RimL family protein N-acetyltransferase [Arenicella sp.]
MPAYFSEGLPFDLKLCGEHVSLEPLQKQHCTELGDAAADGELWNLHFTGVPNRETVAAYVHTALENKLAGTQHPFIVRRISDSKLIGCTRYYDIELSHPNLAIGYTWYSKSVQRSAVNTETKLLLLSYAFERLRCISVAFHTDDQNLTSQAAIARLGATKEGVLRNHKRMPDGRIRHTWCFSIIDSEWPEIKQALTNRLHARS